MAYFHINEALENINKLRTAANEAVKAGKTPDVKPETFDLMERMTRNMWGDFSKGRASIQEALTTTDTVSLIPKIIEGKLREAAEPEYLGTSFSIQSMLKEEVLLYM